MLQIDSNQQLASALATARAAGKRIALVPTMGALHDGHLSLVRLAQERCEFVLVSIFVNPLQFAGEADFAAYPRTLATDLAKLAAAGVDAVYTPTPQEVLGATLTQEAQVSRGTKPRQAGPVGRVLEGSIRPGHFDGMLTIVGRLFDLVQPNVAVFGQKDAQQLWLVQRMVEAEYPGLELVQAPTVREASGVAASSRNAHLTADEREQAKVLPACLRAAATEAGRPGARASDVLRAGERVLAGTPAARLDYLVLVDQRSFTPVEDDFVGEALLLVAARFGQTRLLDNLRLAIGGTTDSQKTGITK